MWHEDIVTLISNAGLGVAGTTLFVGARAALPDTVTDVLVSVIPTPGRGPTWTQNAAGPAYVHPACSVIARVGQAEYNAAMTRICAIRDLLGAVRNQFINGTWYVTIKPRSEPHDLTPDELQRIRIQCLFDGMKRP